MSIENESAERLGVSKPSFRCEVCGGLFQTRGGLRGHQRIKHEGKSPARSKIPEKENIRLILDKQRDISIIVEGFYAYIRSLQVSTSAILHNQVTGEKLSTAQFQFKHAQLFKSRKQCRCEGGSY